MDASHDNRRFRKVDTYDRLERFVRSWMKGAPPMLAIVGPAGRGKSSAYEQALNGKPYHLFRGRTTAIHLYTEVKERPHLPIVFDDVRQLLREPSTIDTMKQLCDSRPERQIRWRTKALPDAERQFACTSTCLVVLNEVRRNDPDVEAIIDRLDVIRFDPTKAEIIRKMRSFAKCQRDVDVIAEAPVLPSLRTLIKYQYWKESEELDEVRELYDECGVPDSIQMIMSIIDTCPRKDWIKTYQQSCGKSYEAAKREWSRKSNIARQLLDARRRDPESMSLCPHQYGV